MVRHKAITKQLFWFGLIIAVALLSGVLKPVQEAWWMISKSIQGEFYQAGYYISWWWQTPKLLEERNALLKEKYTWAVDQAKLINLEREKKTLEEALRFFSTKKFDYLGVRIVTRDKFNERLVTLDQGQKSGVEKGQVFVNEQGVVLGKVVEVGPDRAIVLLLNDPKSQLAVAIENADTLGLVQGRLGGGLIINYVPFDTQLKTNEVVYTSGLEPLIPSGLVVGLITSITKEIGDLFQEASVQSLVNFQEINQGWLIR